MTHFSPLGRHTLNLLEFHLTPTIQQAIGPTNRVLACETIQGLWGGYGQLMRIKTDNPYRVSVIIKAIDLPEVPPADHPKGWSSQRSHLRKLKSYQVEFAWYQQYVPRMPQGWVPQCIVASTHEAHYELVLEDLKLAGCDRVVSAPTAMEIETVLTWLARFHAFWLGADGDGLWEQGTYWHLATRPDELATMASGPYKDAAEVIDHVLRSNRYQTLVHGDAKLANFCFNHQGSVTRAVDFQYVGGGVGVKDVALFFASALDFSEPDLVIDDYLDHYFSQLQHFLSQYQPLVDSVNVCTEWRALFGLAWADYQRFLLGWSPQHPRLNDFTMALCNQAISEL